MLEEEFERQQKFLIEDIRELLELAVLLSFEFHDYHDGIKHARMLARCSRVQQRLMLIIEHGIPPLANQPDDIPF